MTFLLRGIWLVLAVALLAACGGEKHAQLPAGAKVLVLGDSVSFGTGAAKGEDYPTLLAARTGWDVVNAGVPGDTSAAGLLRLPELLEAEAPQLLLIELGGNDFLRKVPRQETVANLKAMIDLGRKANAQVVLIAMAKPNLFGAAMRSLSDEPLYREVADEMNVPLVEDMLSEVLSKNELKSDPIHPNAAGYHEVADRLVEALRELGLVA